MMDKRRRRTAKAVSLKAISYGALAALSLLFLFPFIYMIFKGFMTSRQVNSLPVMFFPSSLNWVNYKNVLSPEYFRYLRNTLIVIGFNIIAIPFAASFCAFGFTRCRFKGRELMFMLVLATIMLPGVVTQVPVYVIFVKLGWTNTLLPLTVPNIMGGGAINIFLCRQYMKTLPLTLDDAAKIDGAGKFTIYFRLILPLVIPVLTMIAISVVIGTWNDFSAPLIYIRDPKWYTLGLGIYYKFTGGDYTVNTVNLQMALGVLTTLPMIIVFFIFQKRIIGGIAVSGIKA